MSPAGRGSLFSLLQTVISPDLSFLERRLCTIKIGGGTCSPNPAFPKKEREAAVGCLSCYLHFLLLVSRTMGRSRLLHRSLLRFHDRTVAHRNHDRVRREGSIGSRDSNLVSHSRRRLQRSRKLEREVRRLGLHRVIRDSSLQGSVGNRSHRRVRNLDRLALHRIPYLARIL